MALTDHSPARTLKGPQCGVSKILSIMPPADVKQLNTWLDNPTVYGSWIGKVCREEGYDISDNALNRHRDLPQSPRQCQCGKAGQ